jgi:hypothetical protein
LVACYKDFTNGEIDKEKEKNRVETMKTPKLTEAEKAHLRRLPIGMRGQERMYIGMAAKRRQQATLGETPDTHALHKNPSISRPNDSA